MLAMGPGVGGPNRSGTSQEYVVLRYPGRHLLRKPKPKAAVARIFVREVCNTIIHSKWEGNARFGFDIALLELKEPSTKTAVPISTVPELPLGDPLSAVGWGWTEAGRNTTLQEVLTLEVVDQSACNTAWAHEPISIIESMVCADGPAGGDTCKGDSGGPLLQNGELVGITSFGPKQCGIVGTPAVYTRVASFAAWIESRGAGAKAAKPVSKKDKLSALISNDKVKRAAKLIGALIAMGDSATVVESVVEVSISGRAQSAVKVILQAAEDGVSEDALIAAMSAATKLLPDKDKPISSGVAVGRSVSNEILPLIEADDVDGAAERVAIAMEAKDSESVLQAMTQAIADGNQATVSAVLVAAIKDHDADPAELAAILSPMCRDDDACSAFLIEIANS
ncbi:hypothetical protein BSKO_11514 [Bryopsis sp. KO-2023]|nr:hypothetical protein BSKO_11514 [Bryopsis sp. KO-2023]